MPEAVNTSVRRSFSGRRGWNVRDIDLVEITEVLLAQLVPSYEDHGIALDRLDGDSGETAVGHACGLAGARLQNTVGHSLDRHVKTSARIPTASTAATS